MQLLICVLLCIVISTCSCRRTYTGYKLVEISIESENDIKTLEGFQQSDAQVSFWHLPHSVDSVASCAVSPDYFVTFCGELDQAGLDYKVTHDDLGREIQEEQSQLRMMGRSRTSFFNISTYNRHADINDYLETLVGQCSDKGLTCEIINIGQSYEGRDMNVIKIGTGGEKQGIWIDAGIHAREWITPATAVIIANKLINKYNKDSETETVLNYFDWYILPSANPDGYEYSIDEDRLWRKTRSPNEGSDCFGADPNRNWGYHWGEAGVSDIPCWDIYAGSKAFSEIETQNMAQFILQNDFKMYISIHAYGQFWLTPWAYTEDVPDDFGELVHLGNIAAKTIYDLYGKEYTVGSVPKVLYAASGSSMDWTKGVAGIEYSFAAELRDKGTHGFLLPPDQIRPVGRETFLAIQAMALEVINMMQQSAG